MTRRSIIARIGQQKDINFLLTNRIPRRWLTLLTGWVSQIRNPWVARAGIALWRAFAHLDLSDAKQSRFASLHECFTRELKEGSRPVDADPAVIVSPCDAIVGESGRVEDGMLLQAKGFPYSLAELLGDERLVKRYRNGRYVTLRLTSGMYHRFHAPHDCRVQRVNYISGDTWNVNPIALRRIERLFCKNERAVIECRLQTSDCLVTLVPVAAILVASIRLHFVDILLHLRYRGPNVIPCDASLRKGEEMGWFQHGSTILVFAPEDAELSDTVRVGGNVRVGEPLMRLAPASPPT